MNFGSLALQVFGLGLHLPQAESDLLLLTTWCVEDEATCLRTQASDFEVTRIDGLGRAT